MKRKSNESPVLLSSYGRELEVAVIGANGGIGRSFINQLAKSDTVKRIFACARTDVEIKDSKVKSLHLDLTSESSILQAGSTIKEATDGLSLIVVSTGTLHNPNGLFPEKTWRELDAAAFQTAFAINTIGPALIAKHFLPLLTRGQKSLFAALSARVGSIGDNRLGGWHAYRASKSALNMLIRTLSIELKRRNPDSLIVGLHPGTVDTHLSQPFQKSVPNGKLFSPDHAVGQMLGVIDQLIPEDTGYVYAWDGERLPE